MGTENFYEILGVSENASQDEIKKAYRKKAIEHHPDKGGSEEYFKKITEAYENIGDENKRRDYDNRKNNPFHNNQGGGFGNPFEDFFNQHFGGQRRNVVPDKIVEVNIGVVESYKSVDKEITFSRKTSCDSCNGNGGEKDICVTCGGNGFFERRMGGGFFTQVVRHACNDCRGEGFKFKTICYTCNGESTKINMETVKIKIPHGIDNGQMFRLNGKGDFIKGFYGNLVVKFNLYSESNFEKEGNDLIYNCFLNLDDLKKENVTIPHPDGNLLIKLPVDFDSSKPLRVKSKGFKNNGFGDLFIRLYVKFRRTP
jgi:molecular chaperone DnaJ